MAALLVDIEFHNSCTPVGQLQAGRHRLLIDGLLYELRARRLHDRQLQQKQNKCFGYSCQAQWLLHTIRRLGRVLVDWQSYSSLPGMQDMRNGSTETANVSAAQQTRRQQDLQRYKAEQRIMAR